MAQLLYAAPTWTLKKSKWAKVVALEMQSLRRVVGWRGRRTDEGIRYPKNADVTKRISEILGTEYIAVRRLAESRQLLWWGMVLRMSAGAMVKEGLLSKIPKPSRLGWKGTMSLVAMLQKRAQEAGLTDKDLWVRSRWGMARPKTSETKETRRRKT